MQTHPPVLADQSQQIALANGCGVLLRNDTTLIRHSGPDALDLLHRLTTKDLLSVEVGGARRTALTSDRGRVIDVFLVGHVAERELLLISDSPDPDRTISAIDYYTIIEDAELANITESHSRISLVGPRSAAVVESTLGIAGADDEVSRTSYESTSVIVASDTSRGVDWLDVVCEAPVAGQLADQFLANNGTAIDAENFELFRISHEIPGSDKEYGEHSNPIEAGLLPLIDFDKGCYVGQEVIARLDAYDKVQRNLKLLESDEPISGDTKLAGNSKPAGVVTSGSELAIESGRYLSLALVRKAFLEPGTTLDANGTPATVQ